MIGFKTQSMNSIRGSQIWRVEVSDIEIFHPTLSQGLLWIVFCSSGGFHTLDVSSRTPLQQLHLAPPAPACGCLVIGTIDHTTSMR